MSKYYTDEQSNFIKENYLDFSFPQLSNLFFEKFGVRKSANTLAKYCNSIGLFKTTKRENLSHHFNDEEKKFIKNNARNYSNEEMQKMFNDKFGTNISLCSYQCIKQSLDLTNKQHIFSDEEDMWLVSNFGKMQSCFMYDVFREKFKTNISNNTIRKRILQLGIDTKRHVYTDEQNNFLKENVTNYTYPKLTEIFNNKFGANVSVVSIRGQCHQYLNAKRGKNAFSASTLPIGTEKVKNGMIYVKVSEVPFKRWERWVAKSRIVYEKHKGEIPKGYRVIFLDGNKFNLDIDNLYAIPSKIHTMLNQNSWYVNDRESMLAKIKYCELFYMLKER